MASALSFYFFDFDDNIMFLDTQIYIHNTETGETKGVSTGQFADIQPFLGKDGEYKKYEIFSKTINGIRGSYNNFRDILENELKPGQKQYFVKDVEEAIASDKKWQAPSWDLFKYACEKHRPVSIITARGHKPETLKAGVRVLVENGKIRREPNYHTIFPVGNDGVRRGELKDPQLSLTTPELKKRAIRKSVDKAMEEYGKEPEHCFGMSDDDPQNVSLIVRAMRDCKDTYPNQRFFVISTHAGEEVKLEVFPPDYPVTRRGRRWRTDEKIR